MRQLITDIDDVRRLLPTWYGYDFAFDTETSGLDYRRDSLLGIALYFSNGDSYYIAIAHTMPCEGGHKHVEFMDRDALAALLAPLFFQDLLMVAHNAKFDMHFLGRVNIAIEGRLADTLLAAQLLDENRENDLKSLAVLLLGMEYAKYQTMGVYKGFKKEEILGAPLEDVAEYAMNDVEATWKLYHIFAPQLADTAFRDKSLQDVYHNIWMPLLGVLQKMEEHGIALDIEKVRELRVEYDKLTLEYQSAFFKRAAQLIIDAYGDEIPEMYLQMATADDLENITERDDGRLFVEKQDVMYPIITYDMVGRSSRWRPRILTINAGSQKQLPDIIFNLSGIELPPEVRLKTTTKGLSADRDNLETIHFYLAEKTPQHVLDLLNWRKASKFVSTYLIPFEEKGDIDDFYAIHTSFMQDGAKTGRLASRDPNLQNIPSRGPVGKQARLMFVARPERVLIVADLGQAELRMLAHYSMDKELLRAFDENRDLHILTGAGFARMDYQELMDAYNNGDPKAKDLRMLGKTGNFALTYGMGPDKFRRYLIVNNGYEVTYQQAKEWIVGYNETYIGATEWKKGTWNPTTHRREGGVEQWIRKNGYVVTFAGRYRRLPWAFSEDKGEVSYAIRQGINAIIQGSVGDIICMAMILIQPELEALGGTLLLQIHDELVAEMPIEHAEEGKAIMERLMIRDCNPKLRCPQIADAHIGHSWGEAKG